MSGASLKAIEIARSDRGEAMRQKLRASAAWFRERLASAGFTLLPGEHPIIPVMLGEARVAQQFAAALLEEGVFASGFSYPVVPMGRARIRTQMSAAHEPDHLKAAAAAFDSVGRRLEMIR